MTIIRLFYFLIFVAFLSINLSSCNGVDMELNNKLPKFNELPAKTLKKLSKKKIYFGHQSIGYEIINGIENLQSKYSDLAFTIHGSSNADDFKQYNLLHSGIGGNFDPISKIDAFAQVMNNGIGNKADIAFFKFCYVDMNKNSNIEKIFKHYKETMDRLEKKYPNTKFVHLTTPLVSEKLPIIRHVKNIVNSILGRYVTSSKLNYKRTQFNELMRKNYEGKANLFDLAMIESIRPDGTRVQYKKNNIDYYAMYHEYTYDGGHLNETGRKMIAEQLIIFLSKL